MEVTQYFNQVQEISNRVIQNYKHGSHTFSHHRTKDTLREDNNQNNSQEKNNQRNEIKVFIKKINMILVFFSVYN